MNHIATETYSKTGYLQSGDQTPLYYRHFGVKNNKATVLLVHGFGEHAGRYSHVIDKLRQDGFEVFTIDLRGHGHSKGIRGDVEKFSKYEEDVLAGVRLSLKQKDDAKKFFILAHSMGALASLGMASKTEQKIDGLVFSSPFFGAKLEVSMLKKIGALTLAKICPKFRVASEIKGEHLSSDKTFLQLYKEDPLVLKSLSVRAFREITKGYKNAKNLAQPQGSAMLVQVAGRDLLVDSQAIKTWFDEHKDNSHDATIKYYPTMLHEIYNEIGKEEPIGDVIKWLNERV